MANREAEQAVAAAFHLMRSLGKQKPDNGADRILAAIIHRNRVAEAQRLFQDKLARWDWERGQEA